MLRKGLWCLLLALPWPVLAADSPFLWSLRVGGVTHYLQGSVHLLPEAAHPLPAPLEAAYTAAEALVFESDLDALSAPALQSQMRQAALAGTGGLAAELPPALYARVRARAQAERLPVDLCDPFKAWFCALTLEVGSYQEAGFSAELGLDPYYHRRAKADGKTIAWLEPTAQHLALFSELTPALAQQLLQQVLDGMADEQQLPAAMYAAWRDNDRASIERLLQEMQRDYPQIYRRVVADRNHAWVPQLLARFRSGHPQLVVVGAAHLIGPDGLLTLLRAQGLTPQPVPLSPAAE